MASDPQPGSKWIFPRGLAIRSLSGITPDGDKATIGAGETVTFVGSTPEGYLRFSRGDEMIDLQMDEASVLQPPEEI